MAREYGEIPGGKAWVLHGGKYPGGDSVGADHPGKLWVSGWGGRGTDPALVIEGLLLRWTLIEPSMCVRLRPRLCEHLNGKNKQIGQRLGAQVLMQDCLCLRPALPRPDLCCDPEQVYNLGPRLPHE